jgi:uncharacterized protein with GYD domain
MSYYLFQGSYTPEAWAHQIKNPQSRIESLKPAVERCGGKIEGLWYAFGEYDVVVLAQFPDNESAAGLAVAAAAGGAVKSMKTTPLMTMDEGINAMKKAKASGYHPPR